MNVSKKQIDQAIHRGASQLYIPWPEVLGQFTDDEENEQINAYVQENVRPDAEVKVTKAVAGRNDRNEPCIVVRLEPRKEADPLLGQETAVSS